MQRRSWSRRVDTTSSRRSLELSFKLAYECTNNEAEYEALMLAILILKDFKVKKVLIRGDFELVIKKLQGEFQA